MFDVNRVTLIGYLGHKPEICQNTEGTLWTWLRIATNTGADETPPVWHSVLVFNNQAQACVTHLDKGSRIYVEGRINQFKKEEDDYPQNNVLASRVIFLGSNTRAEDEAIGA